MLHAMKTKEKTKSRRIKAGKQNKTDDLCPFGRVSVQETLYIHFHTGHIISSFACGSHINILINSGAKHFVLAEDHSPAPSPFHNALSRDEALTLDVKCLQKKSGGFATHLCCPKADHYGEECHTYEHTRRRVLYKAK